MGLNRVFARCAAVLGLGLFVIALPACSTSEVTFGGPLDLQITSNSPVTLTDSLRVEYSVDGRSLLGLAVEWGDAQVDSLGFSSAQSASGITGHLYEAAGTYTVRATAVDQLEGSQSKELTITINP